MVSFGKLSQDEKQQAERKEVEAHTERYLKENEVVLEESTNGGVTTWAPKDVEKARDLTPQEKTAFDQKQVKLEAKAELRQTGCWELGCGSTAKVWVKEVCFDLKEEKAQALAHAVISTEDFDGPVPGFCRLHTPVSPARLAEAVYFNHPLVYWGLRPTRWFVSLTDGSIEGGDIRQIDPKQLSPIFKEEFIKAGQEAQNG